MSATGRSSRRSALADAVEEAAGRLYGLPLEDFTRERDALARELRRAKERDAAAAVAKLPKPSQAAWAANHLARERRDLVDAVLAAGEELRAAQDAAVAGKGAAELRKATAAERAAVDALVEEAKALRPGGRRPTATTLDRLRTTLHAAAADDKVRAALTAGRLVEDAQGGGAWGLFGGATAEAPAGKRTAKGGKRRAADRAAAEGKKAADQEAADRRAAQPEAAEREGAEREAAEREAAEREAAEREAAEREAREERRRLEAELREAKAERKARDRELERAERQAERAVARLHAARAEAEEAQAELDAAREAAERARDHAARLEEQLD